MRVQRVAVIGAGTMVAAIAELLAFNGIEVVLKDVSPEPVDRGLARVRRLVDELVAFHSGRVDKEQERLAGGGIELTPEQLERLRSRWKPKVTPERGRRLWRACEGITDWSPLGEVDLVIEAVFEELSVKREVLSAVDRALPVHGVIPR